MHISGYDPTHTRPVSQPKPPVPEVVVEMSAPNGTPRTAGRTEDAVEVGVPFDLLLSRATEGSWRNLVPSPKSTLQLAGKLVWRPKTIASEGKALTTELARVATGRSE